MFISPKNTDLLLIEAQNENLYLKLIEQLLHKEGSKK